MIRAMLAAAGLALLAGCAGGGYAGPAMSSEPTSLGNNSAGVVSTPAPLAYPSDSEGVGTNGVSPDAGER